MVEYDFDGGKYAEESSIQRSWGEKILKELDLSGNERVCDLGCGEGALARQLARLVPRGSVLGIDASESMITQAKKRTEPNLAFCVMDILDMDFDKEFDLVFSNSALHWVLDHQSLWEKIKKSLKPGGRVRVKFAARGTGDNFNRAAAIVMKKMAFSPYFENMTWPWFMPDPDSYRDFLKAFDLEGLLVWEENADQEFESAVALNGFVAQVAHVPLLVRVPASLRDSFRRDLEEETAHQSRQDDGSYKEHFRRLNVYAVKKGE